MTNPNLGQELITKASEINSYMRTHEGEYALRKTSLMLGRLASQYSEIPIFASASIVVGPTEHGVGAGMGELTGTIKGFSFDQYPANILTPDSFDSGVVLNMSTPIYNDIEAKDAEAWRLNVLPNALKDPSIEGFVVSIPLIEGQVITQIGEKIEEIVPESFLGRAEQTETYSYRQYVNKIRNITGGRAIMDEQLDAPRMQAVNELVHNMVFKCPFLGEIVAIESEYLRSPKPNNETGFKVSTGVVAGILRKFIIDIFQDYRTKEWKSDIHAVIYTPEVAAEVVAGNITGQHADTLPTTFLVPLSEPHYLATNNGIKD